MDKSAKTIGAVNTILNQNGVLIGYNTDTTAIMELLKKTNINIKDKILIIGAGGVAKAVIYALKSLGLKKICVANRTYSNLKKLNKICRIKPVKYSDISKTEFTVLINATSLGMKSSNDEIDIEQIKNNVNYLKLIFDVVVRSDDTNLIRFAKHNKIKYISGIQLGQLQAMHQFRLYTGKKPPKGIFLSK